MFDEETAVKLIAVPAFRQSRSIVLLDLETLDTYEMKFNIDSVMKGIEEEDEEMVVGKTEEEPDIGAPLHQE